MAKGLVIKKERFLALVVLLGFSISALVGAKVYVPWPQVLLLHNSGLPISELAEHFHFARYLAAYPGLVLEDALPGFGYSFFVSIIISLNVILFWRFYRIFLGFSPNLFIVASFLLIHVAMNGRGPIGWFGWLLCLDLFSRLNDSSEDFRYLTMGSAFRLIGAILFASVSSGVFIVVFSCVIYFSFRVLKQGGGREALTLSRLFVASLVFGAIGYSIFHGVIYVFAAVEKLLFFFGSFSEIISHGVGALELSGDSTYIFLAFSIGALFVFFVSYVLRDRLLPDVWVLSAVAMVGGAFGFTTLTLTIPLILVLLSAGLSLFPRSRANEII